MLFFSTLLITFSAPSNVTSFLWAFFKKHWTSGKSFPGLAWRVETWFSMCGENSTCHFKLSLVTFSGAPFSVIFIFSSGAQCIYQHCTAQAPTPSQALIHKNLSIVRACACLCETEGTEGVYARTGRRVFGESLLTFSEPIGRHVRFSRWPMRQMERLEVGVA